MFADIKKRFDENTADDKYLMNLINIIHEHNNRRKSNIPTNKNKNMYDYFFPNKIEYEDLVHEYNYLSYGDTTHKRTIQYEYKKNCRECNGNVIIDNSIFLCEDCGLFSEKNHVEYSKIIDNTRHNKFELINTYNKIDHLSRCLEKHHSIPIYVKNKVLKMFRYIQKPLQEIYDNKRKNFLNYSYVVRKILYIIGHKQYCKLFPVLKSKKRIKQHDRLWDQLTKKMNLPFTPYT